MSTVSVLSRRLLDLVLPPLCLSCGTMVGEPGALCPACFAGVRFVAGPVCPRCGEPHEQAEAAGATCGACLAAPPPWGQARAAFLYDDGSKALVLRFKHADRTEGVPAYARWMARAGADLLETADLLLPVPLHPWRLFLRRYNQAALLAHALGRLSGVPSDGRLLVRRRRTLSQGAFDHTGRGRAGRARNVKGAFSLAQPEAVDGRHVVLVDDVLTTGATLGECTRVLLATGAARVDVLTLARVPRPAGVC